MEIKNKKSIMASLSKFNHFCKESDFIEVTEWANGEGYDININGTQYLSLHYTELDAINFLTKCLEYNETV